MAIFLQAFFWLHITDQYGCDGIPNHQPHNCSLNHLFRRRSKKTSKLCVTGLCAGNSPVTSEFPTQRFSNVENVSIWWRHHGRSHNDNFFYTHHHSLYLLFGIIGSLTSRRIISTAHHILTLRNDKRYQFVFMFPKNEFSIARVNTNEIKLLCCIH